VSSLVEDVIMPPLGQLLNHVNFSELFITQEFRVFVVFAS